MATLAQQVQQATGGAIELAYAEQGDTGSPAALAAQQAWIQLEIVKHHEGKREFLLLPERWVVERAIGWLGHFRRLARDYERLSTTLAAWHWLAFLTLVLRKMVFEST